MDEKILLEMRKKWYLQPSIQEQILNSYRVSLINKIKKELTILTKEPFKPNINFRYGQVYIRDNLTYIFNELKFLNTLHSNLYCSVSDLNYIPKTTMNLAIRREQPEYKEFEENYAKYVTGYDLFFDIDNLDLIQAHKDATQLKQLLEKFKVPFFTNFSGKKGFHFVTPFKYVNWKIPSIEIFRQQLQELVMNIKGIYAIASIDDSLGDIKRVRKVPYSLDYDKVILPLDDNQFETFSKDKMSIEIVYPSINLFNRGLLIREYGLTQEELSANFKQFINQHL